MLMQMFSDSLPLYSEVISRLVLKGMSVATAESCTGGLLGAAFTEVAGSSAVYMGGIISYSNRIKTNLLGVPKIMLDQCGAVSAEVAAAMASGARLALSTDIGISTTGIAGPGGAVPGKPVGTVYVGLDIQGALKVERLQLTGSRSDIRQQTVISLMQMLLNSESLQQVA